MSSIRAVNWARQAQLIATAEAAGVARIYLCPKDDVAAAEARALVEAAACKVIEVDGVLYIETKAVGTKVYDAIEASKVAIDYDHLTLEQLVKMLRERGII
jgi:threonine dehydrogenase-like Zn-dependent dehydrogenase